MPISRIATFQQTTPRRPGEGDVLAGAKTNSTPTVPVNMASAEEWEQMARLLVAYGRMVPLVRATVTFPSGTPTFGVLVSTRDDVLASEFVLFDTAAGDTELRIPSAKFPALQHAIVCLADGAAGYLAPACELTSPGGGFAGVRVRTRNAAGALADVAFSIEVF